MTGSTPTDGTGVPLLIEVWAPWCSSCRAMDGYRDEVAARFAGTVRFVRVNALDEPEAAERLHVKGTPTFIGHVDGVEVYRATGRQSQARLDALFSALAAGGVPSRHVDHSDAALRAAAGVALVVAGLAVGPAWPLVGIGAIVAATAIPVPRRIRAGRP